MFSRKAEGFNTVEEVRGLLRGGVEMRASDIHIEPFADMVRVRLRIDGVLHPHRVYPVDRKEEIAAVVKVMADLDSTQKRIPQDGKFTFNHHDLPIEARVSVLPFRYGEKIVIRLQSAGRIELDLDRLELGASFLTDIRRIIAGHQGLILVTGSTGSGKTTTIYSMLSSIASDELNIVTLEDPIEYEIPGFIQLQMAGELQLSFAEALKAVLRQDPDVLVIGEIRDRETARIAIRAALTGHLVFSSLHSNDAVDAIVRLREMDIEPYLLAAAVKLITYQRLVRRLCPYCKEPTEIEAEAAGLFELPGVTWVFWPRGCKKCNHTGYLGRKPLFQLILVNEEVAEILSAGEKVGDLRQKLKERLSTDLLAEARRSIIDGVTSCEEAARTVL